MKKTAKRVFQLIEGLNVNDYQFSREYGFSNSTLNNWRNNNTTPSPEKIEEFCRCIGISVDEFYTKGILSREESEAENRFMQLKVLSAELEKYHLLETVIDFSSYLLSKENEK